MTSAGRAYSTAGQEFAAFLRDHHIGTHNWVDVSRALISTGRGERWTTAVQDMAILHLARRLIAAASEIVGSRSEWDLVADSDIKQMIVDTMVVDYFLVNDIHARLVPAVAAARQDISPGTRRQLKAVLVAVSDRCQPTLDRPRRQAAFSVLDLHHPSAKPWFPLWLDESEHIQRDDLCRILATRSPRGTPSDRSR